MQTKLEVKPGHAELGRRGPRFEMARCATARGRNGFEWGRMERRASYGLVTDEGEAQAKARKVGRHPSHQPRGAPVSHPR